MVDNIGSQIVASKRMQDRYLKKLRERVETCIKALDVVRRVITRNIEKGLLPNYTYGTIELAKQYNTIGIASFWEAIETLGLTYEDEFGNHFYSEDGKQFAARILETVHEVRKEMILKYDLQYMINIEQIPGEQCAAKLIQKDKLLFIDKVQDKPLYSNQWIGLQDKATIQHRVEMSSVLDKACSGGSILHFNIQSPFTNFDVAWNMLNYVADKGVTYFAFCNKISACAKNHAFYGNICPKCGGRMETTYQRVVGFLVSESAYSTPRKQEFKKRLWYDVDVQKD